MYGVFIMFISGVVSYFLIKNGYPTAPMMLSFVLAPLLESNMRKAFIISGGSLNIFFTRPITCVLMIIFLFMICTPIVKSVLKKKKQETGRKIKRRRIMKRRIAVVLAGVMALSMLAACGGKKTNGIK